MVERTKIHTAAYLALLLTVFMSAATPILAKRGCPRGSFSVNFPGVEIKEFLKTMAAITRKNILIDEKIRGRIQISSYRCIPRSGSYDFMKQVLEAKNYAVVEEKYIIRIAKIKEAQETNIPQKKNPTLKESGVVTKVVRLPEWLNAVEMANLLRPLIGRNANVRYFRPTNAVVISGYAGNVRRALVLMKELGIQDAENPDGHKNTGDDHGDIHIYRVKNIKADSLAKVLVRLDNPQLAVVKKKGRRTVQRNRNAKIKAVAHKESNTIVVTAKPAQWREIKGIIKRLDQVRKQILLEVLIVEISSSRLNDFGIDWRYAGRNGPHTQFNTGRAIEGNMVDSAGRITGQNTLTGFSLGFLKRNGEILGIFNANVNNANFNVLSAPQVLTLDNQEAIINVGQKVPVRTQERSIGGGTSEATVNSFDYRDAGIKLKFTPHVNASGLIGIDLEQEVTSIEQAQSGIANPTFNERKIKTYVSVKDKQTIVVGGLISSEKQKTVTKIPLLGDIPLIGYIFRRTTESVKRTNLMVFITPHILDNDDDITRITERKRRNQERSIRQRANELKLWPERKLKLKK